MALSEITLVIGVKYIHISGIVHLTRHGIIGKAEVLKTARTSTEQVRPGYGSGEGFGFKAKQQATEKGKTSGEDDYDFEIEGADGSDEDLDLEATNHAQACPARIDDEQAEIHAENRLINE